MHAHKHIYNLVCLAIKYSRYQIGGNEWYYPSSIWNCSCICMYVHSTDMYVPSRTSYTNRYHLYWMYWGNTWNELMSK